MSLIGLFKALLFCFEGLPVLVRDVTSHAPQHAVFFFLTCQSWRLYAPAFKSDLALSRRRAKICQSPRKHLCLLAHVWARRWGRFTEAGIPSVPRLPAKSFSSSQIPASLSCRNEISCCDPSASANPPTFTAPSTSTPPNRKTHTGQLGIRPRLNPSAQSRTVVILQGPRAQTHTLC